MLIFIIFIIYVIIFIIIFIYFIIITLKLKYRNIEITENYIVLI